MKRLALVCVFTFYCLILSSCNRGIGSFENNTIDIEKLYTAINQKSIEGQWQFPILNEEIWTGNEIQQRYAIDLTNLQSFYVKSSVIHAQLGELAFFQSEKDIEEVIQQSITQRIKGLQKEWGDVLLDADHLLNDVKEGKIGQYYYVIVGSDAQKVVNYIQNLK